MSEPGRPEDLERWAEAFASLRDAGSRACPAPDHIWAAVRGEVDADATRSLLNHTVGCGSCAETWRCAVELWRTERSALGPATPAGTPVRERRFDLRIAGLAMAAVVLLAVGIVIGRATWPRPAPAPSPETANTVRPEALAAARDQVAALSAQTARQAREIEDLRRLGERATLPLNVPIVTLEPDAVRGSSTVPTIDLTPAIDLVVLVLSATDSRKAAGYHVELFADGNRVVWQGSGLERSVNDTFTLAVPAALFRQGAIGARLYTVTNARRALLHEYRFRPVSR